MALWRAGTVPVAEQERLPLLRITSAGRPIYLGGVRVAGALLSAAVFGVACAPGVGHVSHTPARGTTRHAVTTVKCPLPTRAFLQPADVPRLEEFVRYPRVTQLPIHELAFKPQWFVRKFSCGSYYGFIARIALTGRFRAENNASARAAGYPIGKWPYVPLTGGIISALSHSVLEIYEGAYRFTSPSAATAYMNVVRGDFTDHITVSALPAGFAAATEVLGTDRHTSERQIGVIGRLGDIAITVWLQGGEKLTWSDVAKDWKDTWARLRPLRN